MKEQQLHMTFVAGQQREIFIANCWMTGSLRKPAGNIDFDRTQETEGSPKDKMLAIM